MFSCVLFSFKDGVKGCLTLVNMASRVDPSKMPEPDGVFRGNTDVTLFFVHVHFMLIVIALHLLCLCTWVYSNCWISFGNIFGTVSAISKDSTVMKTQNEANNLTNNKTSADENKSIYIIVVSVIFYPHENDFEIQYIWNGTNFWCYIPH